jgi:hypothetical protein
MPLKANSPPRFNLVTRSSRPAALENDTTTAGPAVKDREWLPFAWVADACDISRQSKALASLWRTLVSAAEADIVPVIEGQPVRMERRKLRGRDNWCLHRNAVPLIAKACTRPGGKWPLRPKGWLTMDEAVARLDPEVDPSAFADAWRAMTKGTPLPGGQAILDVKPRLMKHNIYSILDRWLIHEDDLGSLAKALEGRLPHIRKGFLGPSEVLGRFVPDAQEVAWSLYLELIAELKATGTATLEGQTLEMRRFLVDGRPITCLHERSYEGFRSSVCELLRSDQPSGPAIGR